MKRKRLLLLIISLLLFLMGIPVWRTVCEIRQERLDQQLITAIKQYDNRVALSALQSGANPNARDSFRQPFTFQQNLRRFWNQIYGRKQNTPTPADLLGAQQTPLLLLFRNPPIPSSATLLKALLKCGADPNITDENGTSPLLLAVYQQDTECVRLLLEHHADPNAIGGFPNVPSLKVTPLHMADAGDAKLLLAYGAKTEIKDSNGATPLLADCQKVGYENAIPILLEHGAAVNVRDPEGETPLHCACMSLSLHTVKALLAKGADIAARTKRGKTVLMSAAEGSNQEVVQFLLQEGLDVNARDLNDTTALIYAADTAVIGLLLKQGANPNLHGNISSDENSPLEGTPLMLAAWVNDQERVRLLMRYGADVNAQDKDGETALKIAREQNATDMMRLLQQHGAVR